MNRSRSSNCPLASGGDVSVQRGGGGGESLRGFCRTHGSVKWRRRMRESESDGGDGGVVPEMSQEYNTQERGPAH